MCRLLAVKSKSDINPKYFLEKFAEVSQNSKEYQGHGWGYSYLQNNDWRIYKNIKPIWEDDLNQFPETSHFLAHARSAFRDQGIKIENNMPFFDEKLVYIFNGELQGVKIKEKGKIGAEKIFNFIKRFEHGDILEALKKAVIIIEKRSEYIRAMNFVISDKENFYINSFFNEDKEYFTMYLYKEDAITVVCSDPFTDQKKWTKIENNFCGIF